MLASRTAPVEELIDQEINGLLTDFFDVDEWVRAASEALDAPTSFAHLGTNGVKKIHDLYSMKICLPKMLDLYERTVNQ